MTPGQFAEPSAPETLASIMLADLDGDAWAADRTTNAIYIDTNCPPADRAHYIARAVAALHQPPAPGRPVLRCIDGDRPDHD